MVEALQTLYIALGGKAKDFTATTTPEAIIAIAKVVEKSKKSAPAEKKEATAKKDAKNK